LDEASGALRFQDGWCVNEPAGTGSLERSRRGVAVRCCLSGDLQRDIRASTKSLAEGAGLRGVLTFAVTSRAKPSACSLFRRVGARTRPAAAAGGAVIGSHVGQFLQRKQIEESLREKRKRASAA